ncbi:MAG: hypothetical protein KDI79_01380 [Anaerolineae bacterium]|nr:hypothetical protein [Anaerolineae bacterium]
MGLIFRADVTKTNTHYAPRPTSYVLRTPLPWLLLALLPSLFYLAVSTWRFGFTGFPLDDAWIHQTYARNLAESGQLAFVPGVPSAGSTSPLWSLLLSLGYVLGMPFKGWTYGLGIIFLGLTGWTAARLGNRLFPESPWAGLATGVFCVFEWHLVWAAVSGMETILFVWLSLFLMERYLAVASAEPDEGRMGRYFGVGLLGGLLVLTRPEGLGLVGLIGLDSGLRWWRAGEHSASALMKRWLGIGLGVVVMVAPYVLFHLRLTGLPFPNTLYAKQAEYGVILSEFPLWWRLFGSFGSPIDSVQGVFRVIFIGAQVLLLPGLAFAAWLTVKERRWDLLPVWGWWIGHLLLYAVRLPVTYQHGRYQMPVIAWMIILGVWGTARLISPSNPRMKRNLLARVGGKALVGSLVMLIVAFTVVGAQAYGRDVRIIESEMVATARWLDQAVEPDALIAAHDIGAIGYFTRRPLIDLAGLITPEVIPIIRDEAALFDFITTQQADYLVTFPSWYPEMTRQPALKIAYRTDALWSTQAGGDNMVVYRIGRR